LTKADQEDNQINAVIAINKMS